MGKFEFLNKMYKMAVWDNEGRQYLPVQDYDGQISHYARATEAIEVWLHDNEGGQNGNE